MSKEKFSTQVDAAASGIKKPEQLIYIGPSKPGLKSNSIFVGKLPEIGETLMKRDVRYKRLFVPLASFPQALKDIKEGGLVEIYKDAVEERF